MKKEIEPFECVEEFQNLESETTERLNKLEKEIIENKKRIFGRNKEDYKRSQRGRQYKPYKNTPFNGAKHPYREMKK